jgi:hypothetical protein
VKKTLEMFEYENDKLSTQSDEKAQKLKGASEKARNLKDVVVSKDEKKTKGSHGDKQRYLESERGRGRNRRCFTYVGAEHVILGSKCATQLISFLLTT